MAKGPNNEMRDRWEDDSGERESKSECGSQARRINNNSNPLLTALLPVRELPLLQPGRTKLVW